MHHGQKSNLIVVGGLFFSVMLFACMCGYNSGEIPNDVLYLGQESGGGFGSSIDYTGDLNGDGTGDIIVGAPLDPGPSSELSAGRAFIVFGGAGITGEIPLPPGQGSTTYSEIITGESGALLGSSVAGIGDFDGDGYKDIAVGLPGARGHVDGDTDDNVSYTGAVQIIYGGPTWPEQVNIDTLPSTRIVGADSADNAGASVASAGDINGDGLPDLVIGAPRAKCEGKAQAGKAYIVYGSHNRPDLIDLETGADVVIQGGEAYGRLGWTVSSAGDMNLDGFPDLAIGAPYRDANGFVDSGEVMVLFGSDNLPPVINSNSDLMDIGFRFSTGNQSSHLGWSLSNSDVNGDGVSDLIAGAPDAGELHNYQGNSRPGIVYVVFGSGSSQFPVDLVPTDLEGGKGLVIEGEHDTWKAGYAVSGIGDYNADGMDDFVLSAPGAFNGTAIESGAVYVLFGRQTWPDLLNLASWADYGQKISGARAYGRFGEVLSSAGDHNGDEGIDFAVGVPLQSEGDLACSGSVSIFFGDLIPKPSGLVCEVNSLEVSLSWMNNYLYDQVRIYRDGELVATVNGEDTSWTDTNVNVGHHTYKIGGIVDPVQTGTVECEIYVQVLPVIDVTCVSEARTATLSWQLGMQYESIRIDRNGDQVAELAGDATSWQETDVPYGALHYEIRGISGGLESIPVACDAFAPPPPSDLSCLAAGRDVVLSWNEPEAYDRVRIVKDGELLSEIPGGAGMFTDNAVEPGVHVYALSSTRGENVSELVSCEVKVIPKPENLTYSVHGYTAAITWESPVDYDSIHIFIDGGPDILLPGDIIRYFAEDLQPGVHLIEIAGGIDSVLSEKASIDVLVLAPPSGLSCSALGNIVTLSWDNNDSYEGITVERDEEVIAQRPGGENSFVDEDVATGAHVYEITASSGDSTTVSASVSCEITVLAPPESFTCNAVSDQVTLEWVNGSNYQQLVLKRDGVNIATLSGDVAEYVDSDVSAGTHNYVIQGLFDSSKSMEVSCELVNPGDPFDLACTASGLEVTLSWQNGDQYDNVIVLRNDEQIASLPADSVDYTDTDVAAGTTYAYKIVGLIGANQSAPASCLIPLPVAPGEMECSAVADHVSITWSFAGDVDGFLVFRNSEQVADLPGDVRSFEENVQVPGTFEYQVSTSLGQAVSAPSTCEVMTLEPPQEFTCISVSGSVELNWTAGAAYDNILVLRDGEQIASLAGDMLTFSDSPLDPGDYEYAVIGVTGGSSSAGATCTAHVPAPLREFNCVADDNGITLSWQVSEPGNETVVYRNNEEIARLAGTEVNYLDMDFNPGVEYTFKLVSVMGDNISEPVLCSIMVPLSPGNFTCAAEGNSVLLTWNNNGTYDSIRIVSNGEVIAADLSGDLETFTQENLEPGNYNYELRGGAGGTFSAPATCSVTVIPVLEDFVCSVIPETGSVRLGWSNPVLYDSITIKRNGEIIAGTVNGTETEYDDTVPGEGTWTYEISGHAFGSESEPATCEVEILPEPVQFSCDGVGDTVELSWVPGAVYESVRVQRDGLDIADLAGTAENYTDKDLQPGTYVYTLIGIGQNGAESIATSGCEVTVVSPPGNLIASVEVLALLGRVTLEWDLTGIYDSIIVERTGSDGVVMFGPISGSDTTYVDEDVPEGDYEYRVIGYIGSNYAASEAVSVSIVLARFIRGNANGDMKVDIADAVWILDYLFKDGLEPPCMDAADITDDGYVDVTDAIYLIEWQFLEGSPPPSPYPAPGVDPTVDQGGGDLGCDL